MPKGNGKGEIVFSPRQIVALITLIAIVASAGGSIATTTMRLNNLSYRVDEVEDEVHALDSCYVRKAELDIMMNSLEDHLGRIGSRLESIDNRINAQNKYMTTIK